MKIAGGRIDCGLQQILPVTAIAIWRPAAMRHSCASFCVAYSAAAAEIFFLRMRAFGGKALFLCSFRWLGLAANAWFLHRLLHHRLQPLDTRLFVVKLRAIGFSMDDNLIRSGQSPARETPQTVRSIVGHALNRSNRNAQFSSRAEFVDSLTPRTA